MKYFFCLAITLPFFLIVSGCCLSADCDPDSGTLKLQFVRDGKNAVFGPDAFVLLDSIQFYALVPEKEVQDLYWHVGKETINLIIDHDQEYLLIIPNIDTMTFKLHMETGKRSDCCPEKRISEVFKNNELICTQDCEQVMVFEI